MKLTILLAFGLFLAAQGAETPTHERGRACFDHKDNDGDGKADCKDPDCARRYKTYCKRATDGKETGRECFDHRDNDGDGKKDCQDPDCLRDRRVGQRCRMMNRHGGNGKHDNPHTETKRECFNHRDDDHDGKTDCQDPDCQRDPRSKRHCQYIARRHNGNNNHRNQAQCTLSGIMGVALVCGNANINDRAFCRSTCYRQLDPFLKKCQNSPAMSSAKALLGVAAGMTRKCDRNGGGRDNPHTETRRECFDGKDNDHDGKSDCADPDCMKDKRIRQRCQMYGGGGKDTGAGDGVCNVLGPAIRSCRGLKDAKEGDKSICKTACIQESFDCIDNKAMAMYRAKIVDIKDMCGGTTIECDSILSNMGKVFQPICCPSNARACARGPPKTCNAKCAQLFVPFFDKCALAIEKANIDRKGQMAHFADVCAASNKH